ncbi:hypothetical protein EHE19_007430 [Ruminiclostridium herbifermentans]|uniref:Uncharacterized protein n=1 Tax=Ruminiclostridium herbifermentans TaxID=2488810 RepID=A0A4U7JP45_9FIRM|nr:hypothetical protein [Ruminiclostridium herbifermentans]QNU68241.1 hypothetical protein EHE19_007430 [Ruminiclostridium herbifermentans]
MIKNIKIKLSDISNKRDSISKFTLSYSAKNMSNSQISYEIVSSLKAENDIIIEINCSFLKLSEKESKLLLSRLTNELDNFGVLYKKRKVLVHTRRTMLSISLKTEVIEGFELFAVIPDEVWKNEIFRSIIPNMGVRYYLPTSIKDVNLDEFIDLEEDERISQCNLVIFDYILSGSMGINTCKMKKEDIQALLNRI